MTATWKQVEAIPAAYPTLPQTVLDGLTTAAAALDADMIWQRIESYIAHRWTTRAVTWIVAGGGDWEPPLTPATISATEIWEANDWAAVVHDPSALGGYVLDGEGPYRFTATVGSGTVPASVIEAWRRLVEYMADSHERVAGASSNTMTLGDGFDVSFDRAPTWLARAMQNSGAGDLLRPYRRA